MSLSLSHPLSLRAPSLRAELPSDLAGIEHLHEVAFGPGRFARAAFHLREGVPADPALSFIAEIDGRLAGSVRLTPITIGDRPALLLGPLAVHAAYRSAGIGGALMRVAIEAARAAGHHVVVLVGDLAYYYPFGFRQVGAGNITMPVPVDPDRLLVAELVGGASRGLRGRARRFSPALAPPHQADEREECRESVKA